MKSKKSSVSSNDHYIPARAVARTKSEDPAGNIFLTAVTREQIAARAYDIWLSEGQPEGRDMDHWIQAERQLGVPASSPERRETQTGATAREIGSDAFPEKLDESLDIAASPATQRSATAL